MVTKGEIQSIDYGGNTCEVRIPYFESAGINDRIIATATIGNQPGMYNGYRAGDVVWIAFEDGEASKPVVIGKLFLGSDAERGDARGVINVESATASSSMTMPINSNLAYEKDASVAQNGETKYGRISDMANKLASITAQQDKTAYNVTGVVSTGNMLKSELASVKAGSGNKSTYQSATRPEETVYEKQDDLSSFSEASSYVGYYIQTGVDKDNEPQYELVTDANKDSLELYPGITAPYKPRKLSDGDIWIYTGPNLFEEDSTDVSWATADSANLKTKEDYHSYYKKDHTNKFSTSDDDSIILKTNSTSMKTVAYYPNLTGYYVYCTSSKNQLSTKDLSTDKKCQEPTCAVTKVYSANSGNEFRLVTSANCDPKDSNYIQSIDASTKKYKLHLAKNQSFYWDGDKRTWVKGEDNRFDEYKSAITQTAEKLQSEFSHTNEKMESYNSAITQRAESITLAVSKTVQGQNKTYAQETKPDYVEVDDSVVKAFTTISDCIGYYYKTETEDTDGNVTTTWTKIEADVELSLSDIKKKTLYSTPIKNDVWIYTGNDLYGPVNEDEDTDDGFDPKTKMKKSQYVGKYICLKTGGEEIYAINCAETVKCPICDDDDFYANTDDYYFKLVTADNYDSLPIELGTTPGIGQHLASNTTFYWSGSEWVEGAPSTLKTMDSAITQTANAIDAKVSKTYNDGSMTGFGWNISQPEDLPKTLDKGDGYHVGDSDGKFVVYSSLKKESSSDEKQTDVLHVNKNGLWVNGNLEVEDSTGQKIFRALPYGDYTEDKEANKIDYDQKPQVQIGGFTVDKDTLTSTAGVSIGPEGLSVNNSGDENQFSVLTDGTAWGKRLYIEQDKKHDSGGADSYFDGNVCGHQMKVDTVELATTNTDKGVSQTDGFRIEIFKVTADKQKDNAVTVTFAIDDVQDKKEFTSSTDSLGHTGVTVDTHSDKCVYCALQDKTISAIVSLTIYANEEKTTQKTITCSVTATLPGIPYDSDGSVSDGQKPYLSKHQSVSKIVIINDESHTLQLKSGDTAEEIAALKQIECFGIITAEILSYAPKKEEYYTGDFYASTGYFKDKYGCFTEGALVDVFSLPWKRHGDRGGCYYTYDVPTQFLKYEDADEGGLEGYIAYKELKRGDFCTICTGDMIDATSWNQKYMLGTGKLTQSAPYILLGQPNYDNCPYADAKNEEILPALDQFTVLYNVNASLIRKYSTYNGCEPLSNELNVQDDSAAKKEDSKYAQSTPSSFESVSTYHISVFNYGTKVSGGKGSYVIDGVKLELCVDDMGKTLTSTSGNYDLSDNEVYVFCQRDLYWSQADEENVTLEKSTFDWKGRVIGVPSDTLSLLIYGSNVQLSIDKGSGEISSSIGTQGSGAYLAGSNMYVKKANSSTDVFSQTGNSSLSLGASIVLKKGSTTVPFVPMTKTDKNTVVS